MAFFLFNPQLHFRREYDCDRLLRGIGRRLVGVCSASRLDAGKIAIDCLLAGFLSALECREHTSAAAGSVVGSVSQPRHAI